MNESELIEKAERGLLSEAQISDFAHKLSIDENVNKYLIILILGRAKATRYEKLIASFLESADTMLVKASLDALCNDWGLYQKYREYLKRFIAGIEQDWDGDLRIHAISTTGEAIRSHPEINLSCDLLNVYNDSGIDENIRGCSYLALARAFGKNWNEVLQLRSRYYKDSKDVDVLVLNFFKDKCK